MTPARRSVYSEHAVGMSLKRLNRQSQLVAVLLIAARLLAGERTHAVPQSAVAETRQAAPQHNPPAATEAREFPEDEYAKLRAEALSKVIGKPGPRIRNPRLSRGGIDRAILAVLEQQRRYLRNSGVSQTSLRRGPETGSRRSLLKALTLPSCLKPVIFAVNGRAVGPVFTPHLGDNHFRIEGCGFGNAPGEVRLEPETDSPSIDIRIQGTLLQLERATAWSENQIDVRLDPRLAGIPDSMTTLVVRLADGQEVELHGCRFVAVRDEPIPLKTIAASWVKLSAQDRSSRSLPQFEFVSPPTSPDIPDDAVKMSAFVIRSDTHAFDPGSDTYDFSALNRGWVVESIQIQDYRAACPGDVTRTERSGDTNAKVEDHALTVNWASASCSSFIPPMFRFTMAASEYAVKVWVMGPIGTEPLGMDRRQERPEAQ